DFHVTGVQTCALPICLDASPVRTVRDHLGLVGSVLGTPDAIRAGTCPPTAGWLAAATDATEDASARGEPLGSFHAPDGGLVVLQIGRASCRARGRGRW